MSNVTFRYLNNALMVHYTTEAVPKPCQPWWGWGKGVLNPLRRKGTNIRGASTMLQACAKHTASPPCYTAL